MNKKDMIKAMVRHYTDGNKAKFARLLGVPPQTLSSWESRGNIDAELIYSRCESISAKWLLSGEGEMIEKPQEPKAQKIKVGGDAYGPLVQGDGNNINTQPKDDDVEILKIKISTLASENERLKKDIEDLRFTKDHLLTALENHKIK